MAFLNGFSIVLLSLLCTNTLADILKENECHRYLRELASTQKDFVQCATLNAVPVELCMSCYGPFTIMTESYATLKNDVNCTNKYFDKDRINIVQTTQNILEGLWTKAYCPDCFNSNNSLNFNHKADILDDCINNPVNKDRECLVCLTKYEDLNDFYSDLDANNKGKICYDMQDLMNRTRSLWSDQYKCCRRIFDIDLFLIAICIVAALPIVFYGSAYWVVKRQEINHGIISAEDTEGSTTNLIASNAAAENHVSLSNSPLLAAASSSSASTSQNQQFPIEKMVPVDSDSDADSDYNTQTMKSSIK